MIKLLLGDNDFEQARAVERLAREYAGEVERIDGRSVTTADLPGQLLGSTLFSQSRMLIIADLSENRSAWAALADYVQKIPEDTILVLLERKPDKRTKTYKILQTGAEISEFKLWEERDAKTAGKWVVAEAGRLGLSLKGKAPELLVERSFVAAEKGIVIDQWRLYSNLEKLAPLGEIGPEEVEKYIEESPVENVFMLLETALKGDVVRVRQMTAQFEATEDPYRLFGLLSGQVFWLAALSVSEKSSAEVARDIGAHPFVLSKLDPYVNKLGKAGVQRVVSAFAEADGAMKRSAAEPWLLIERALLKAAR